MHMVKIRHWLQLLLVAGLCFGTLATTGAVGGAADPVQPTSAPGKTAQSSPAEAGQELKEMPAQDTPVRPPVEPVTEVQPAPPSLTPEELGWLALPNARPDRLDRYIAWMEAHPEDSEENAVLQVNMDQDQEFYSLIWESADPSSLTVLVNKHYTLPAGYIPELEALGKGYGSGSLRPEAAQAFRAMADGARADGFSLRSVSAYRSYKTQKSTYNRYLKQYKQSTVDTFSARPGHSEHQTGLALDINVASSRAHFENTRTFAWLKEHCAEYGFILRYDQGKEAITGYRFEPWHYRYVGTEIAKACMEQGLSFEEYLALQPS